MSSALLYVAIVAIWAGVLIPRWLRRDTSERAATPVAEEPMAEEQPPAPLPRSRDEDAPRARPIAREARRGSEARRADARDEHSQDEHARDGHARDGDSTDGDGTDGDSRGFIREQEHAQVLSARRRLLILLLALAAASCVLAATQLAAWWVMVPPTVMLLGYVALLREAAQADAERRELIRSRVTPGAGVAVEPAAADTVPARAPAPAPAPDAEIINISASVAQSGEELYDQYADAKLRAVGDLACATAG